MRFFRDLIRLVVAETEAFSREVRCWIYGHVYVRRRPGSRKHCDRCGRFYD